MSTKEYPIVDNAESFEAALARVREAQKIFATYTHCLLYTSDAADEL